MKGDCKFKWRLCYSVGVAFAIVLLVWWGWWYCGAEWFATRYPSEKLSRLGALGDLFGGINALFASVALVGIFVAGWLQRLQLLEAQAQAVLGRKQHDRAMFEPLLFLLIDRHKVPQNLIDPSNELQLSFDAMGQIIDRSLSESPVLAEALLTGDSTEFLRLCRKKYEVLYNYNDSFLGPYFRSMYHIFRHIRDAPITEQDKRQYASIARASLSESELLFLALNCLTEQGQGMRQFVELFGLLKHIRRYRRTRSVEQVIAEAAFSPAALGGRALLLTNDAE